MKKRTLPGNLNLGLLAVLLLGMGYLGLVLSLGTSSPFMLVRGSSMEPTFHSGDLLLSSSVSPTEIEVGDVIAFSVPTEDRDRLSLPTTAVHRILGIEGEKGQLTFLTKGDNSGLDPFKVPSSAVRGAVVTNLGPIGLPILFLTNRGVLLSLGLPILTFVLIILATLWLAPGEKREAPAPGTTAVAQTPPGEVDKALAGLASAIADYGVHLKSHTAVVKQLGGSSEGLEQAVHRQNEVLVDLTKVVRRLKGQTAQKAKVPAAQPSSNGAKKSQNGATKTTSAKSSKPKGQTAQKTKGLAAQPPSNGAKKSQNGAAKTTPVKPGKPKGQTAQKAKGLRAQASRNGPESPRMGISKGVSRGRQVEVESKGGATDALFLVYICSQ